MKGSIAIRTAARITALAFRLASAAQAAVRPVAVETFVSGLGNDSNAAANCPWTNPCRTLAGAYPWGSAIGNTTAYLMNNPRTGTGGNKITIFEFLISNTDAAYWTNMTANATLDSGTGASCGGSNCQSLGNYGSYTDLK